MSPYDFSLVLNHETQLSLLPFTSDVRQTKNPIHTLTSLDISDD